MQCREEEDETLSGVLLSTVPFDDLGYGTPTSSLIDVPHVPRLNVVLLDGCIKLRKGEKREGR